MDVVESEVEEYPCVNHPGTSTVVSCGKCGRHICPRCMVFTPVGVRCRDCAQLRPPAQFDVGINRVAAGSVAALAVAFAGWYIALHIFFFAWLASIAVGLSSGEAASRVTKRRVSRSLEIGVGAAIVGGYVLARWVEYATAPHMGLGHVRAALTTISGLNDPFALIMLVLAVVFGITSLRR